VSGGEREESDAEDDDGKKEAMDAGRKKKT
jgi:hypothetical protein